MYQPVMKMKIVFDEEKVKREGKYDINSMYDIVDDYFNKKNLTKIARGEYGDTGISSDYGKLWASIDFRKLDWFKSNLESWTFYEFDDDNNSWDYEDIIYSMNNSIYKYA
jgi:hypothetical protein